MINPDGIILSISGQSLTKEEKSFFKETNPLGFVLFKRNFKDVIQLRDLINQLKKFGGNISKTAKFVGMERSALHRKLKLLGVKDLN